MTGTAVKNAAAILANVAPNAGKNAKGTAASGGVDFQSVWNNQMEKNTQNAADVQTAASAQKKPEQPVADSDDVKPEEPRETGEKLNESTDDRQPAKTDKVSQKQPEQPDELGPEEIEAAMEILGTAAVELMQKIADTFDISMEELQGTLDELDMAPLDLLQPSGLGELVLKLGGAEDSLELLTDEKLCGDYKALMEQMETILNGTAEKLEVDPRQLEALLNERPEQVVAEETVSGEMLPDEEISVRKPLEERTSVRLNESEIPGDGVAKTLTSTAEESFRIEGTVNEPGTAEDRKSGERQSGKEADGGQQGSLFAQEFRPLQPETGMQQTQAADQSAAWNADTQDIMRQIMDYMKLQLNADTTNLEMQLHPASLGTLHIQVEAKAGVITASFIAQNEAVKAALESQIVQLKENFEEQGVKVEAIEVMVQSHAFERNLDQGREQNQGSGEPSRKARVRRINLNDLSAMEDMEEEDALAADMLAAGGSTVDYTA